MSVSQNQIKETFLLQSQRRIQYLIEMSIKSNCLFIDANTANLIPPISYQKYLTLEDIKSNKYFNFCDTIYEVLLELKNIKKSNPNNIKIFESFNELVIKFPLPIYIIKEANFHIERVKKQFK